MSSKFDYFIPSIEVVFDLSEVTPVKLMGLLQSQEERMNSKVTAEIIFMSPEKQDEQALQVFQDQNNALRGRARGGRLSFRGRGNAGRGRGNFDRNKVPQCHCCKKYGHLKKDCWYNEEA